MDDDRKTILKPLVVLQIVMVVSLFGVSAHLEVVQTKEQNTLFGMLIALQSIWIAIFQDITSVRGEQ